MPAFHRRPSGHPINGRGAEPGGHCHRRILVHIGPRGLCHLHQPRIVGLADRCQCGGNLSLLALRGSRPGLRPERNGCADQSRRVPGSIGAMAVASPTKGSTTLGRSPIRWRSASAPAMGSAALLHVPHPRWPEPGPTDCWPGGERFVPPRRLQVGPKLRSAHRGRPPSSRHPSTHAVKPAASCAATLKHQCVASQTSGLVRTIVLKCQARLRTAHSGHLRRRPQLLGHSKRTIERGCGARSPCAAGPPPSAEGRVPTPGGCRDPLPARSRPRGVQRAGRRAAGHHPTRPAAGAGRQIANGGGQSRRLHKISPP